MLRAGQASLQVLKRVCQAGVLSLLQADRQKVIPCCACRSAEERDLPSLGGMPQPATLPHLPLGV